VAELLQNCTKSNTLFRCIRKSIREVQRLELNTSNVRFVDWSVGALKSIVFWFIHLLRFYKRNQTYDIILWFKPLL